MKEERPAQAQRLQTARQRAGFASAREAALRFDWSYDTYSQHERGERGISRSADRYAQAFKVSAGWLLTGEGVGPGEDALIDRAPRPDLYEAQPNSVLEPGPVYLPVMNGPRDIEELGATMGGDGEDESAFEMNGQVVDLVKRPPGLMHRKDVFALRVTNVSMFPKFEDGERIYLEKRKPAIGDYVVVELLPKDEGQPGKSYIKRLLAADSARITVQQFNPKGELIFRRNEIKQLFRVIPNTELIGV